MDIYEVVKKLVGEIDPVGETNTDNQRFENLKTLTELIDKLLTDVDRVAYNNKGSHEHSKLKAREFVLKFFDKTGIKD